MAELAPALFDERVRLNAAGQVEPKLNAPWRDGTTHLLMRPLEFMQRLAAFRLPVRRVGYPDRVACWRTRTAGDRPLHSGYITCQRA
ncbi:MAG: hypothetical protein ACKOZX_10645, partial [Gammaproteobacteria bacterium]